MTNLRCYCYAAESTLRTRMLHCIRLQLQAFPKPDSLRLILVDCDACRLLLSTHFRKLDRKNAILHVCLDIIGLQTSISITPFKLTALEVIGSHSPWYQMGAVMTSRTCHNPSRGRYIPSPSSPATTGSHRRWSGGYCGRRY